MGASGGDPEAAVTAIEAMRTTTIRSLGLLIPTAALFIAMVQIANSPSKV